MKENEKLILEIGHWRKFYLPKGINLEADFFFLKILSFSFKLIESINQVDQNIKNILLEIIFL